MTVTLYNKVHQLTLVNVCELTMSNTFVAVLVNLKYSRSLFLHVSSQCIN